jgi:hypothetical protein
MVDVDHTDEHHGRDTTFRTVAETIPALGGGMGCDGGLAAGRTGGGGGGDDDDAAYYYSTGDGEVAAAAAAGHYDGAVGARHGVRTVASMFSGSLLSPQGQPSLGGKQVRAPPCVVCALAPDHLPCLRL